MVCLDTSFIADLLRKDRKTSEKLEEFINENEKLMTTIINIAELYKGAYGHHRKEEKIKEVDEISQIIFVLDMNIRAAKNYGYLYQCLKKKGKLIDDRDILIASIILSYGENKIVTKNTKHFKRIKEIEVMEY